MSRKRIVGAAAATGVALLLTAVPASAHSVSASYGYPGGDRLEANVYIANISDWHGCGNWATSAKLWGNNPPYASWIKNSAHFHANGVGASISGVSANGSGNDQSASWTNSNAWIADLSGRLCANWLTWYVSATSTATSYVPKYGSPRIVSAGI